jgi:hypothetical protein
MGIPAFFALIAGLWLVSRGAIGLLEYRDAPPPALLESLRALATAFTSAFAGLAVSVTALARLM